MPDSELIVLVDEDGEPIGTADKLASHRGETPLHCVRVAWSDFVQAAQTDSDNLYSWWCKDQLAELEPVGQQERAAAFATAPTWLRWPRATN